MAVFFSRLESLLYAWPDQLPEHLQSMDFAETAAIQIRRQSWQRAESIILSGLAVRPNDLNLHWLLIFLRLSERQLLPVPELLDSVREIPNYETLPFWYLHIQYRLCDENNQDLASWYSKLENQTNSELLRNLSLIAIALRLSDFEQVNFLIENFVGQECLEFQRLKARWLLQIGQGNDSIELLKGALKRFPNHLGLARQISIHAILCKASTTVIPALRHGISHHGEAPEFLTQLVQVKLMQRQPSLGRRCALLASSWSSTIKSNIKINIANHVSSYEQCGNVEWLSWLLPNYRDPWADDFDFDLLTNLNLQYASIESPIAAELGPEFCKRLRSLPVIAAQAKQAPKAKKLTAPMRIAWVSGDIAYHPVSRFLLSFLEHANSFGVHENFVVVTEDHREYSLAEHFQALPSVEILDLSHIPKSHRVPVVRDQHINLAVDLSGWTGGGFQPGFLARLAPLQINYLGYFASTGNPSIDYWMGDEQLFPRSMMEWHSEKIHRLQRCFLAWQPSKVFPEALISVTDPPKGGIRFGSFNHNRKLSNSTLALWGQILESIPDSRLVLKANDENDQGTQELLRRRMLRQGLDPERVIWLQLTASSEDHLKQYSQIDIALDCFPNGGCTTTCEALWMGVPVITLTGNTYVSRMSTAVLHGADMAEWCVKSRQEYLDLAIEQAQNLPELRSKRVVWREKVLQNPLGDAKNLMKEILSSFEKLYDLIV